MSNNQFKLQINLTKSYVGEDGGHYLEGVASGPEVDLTGERMSPDALQSMVASLQKRLVEFRDAHRDEWNDDLGQVVALELDENNHLIYRSKLDMNLSGAKDLWYRVHTLGKKYGVSIGGAVLKAGMEYVAELGRQVYTYFDVDLYEISITRQAAYQYSFANAVLKSLPKGTPMSENKETAEVEKTEGQDDQETTEAQTEEVTEQEETVAAEEQSDATETTQTEGQEVETEDVAEEAAVQETDAEAEATEDETEAEEETTEEAAEAAETEESPAEDLEVTKALTEAQAEAETLKKSLADAAAQVEELNKSLTTKTQEAEAAQTELAEVKKSLGEKERELEKRDTRKAIVFDKFSEQTVEKSDEKKVQQATNEKWAGFITGGIR